ncbi:MAG TPA: formate-dependent phosphoribosylglycinamide formyltransferase [Mycobacteriales bacterium]|jgi:phosphoribosylglycinamide formyltransferase 2|nr:formate-dependent phosphoribosylglycinamide formyltransferase [Mycobacteriales bacterium]
MTRLLLLGAGELGKEVALEAAALGVEVIAADRYDDAPAMQVTPHRRVLDMLDPDAVRALVEETQPDFVVPEVEAIATETLLQLETEGWTVIPTARAARLTMDREGIRRLAAETLGLPTSPYRFATNEDEYVAAVTSLGRPCVVKPVMSSSGKGQSVVGIDDDPMEAWRFARTSGRVADQPVIIEGFVDFVYELTMLTVRHAAGTTCCPPIGHLQEGGDYRESWQPQPMSALALERATDLSVRITDELGGRGVFGVELFVTVDDQVLFSEVSPRPHDTGLVTLLSQATSEFGLHVRAILGLPVRPDDVANVRPCASAVVLADAELEEPAVAGVAAALTGPGTKVRVFGKPSAHPGRRMAVAVADGSDVDDARTRARAAASAMSVVKA